MTTRDSHCQAYTAPHPQRGARLLPALYWAIVVALSSLPVSGFAEEASAPQAQAEVAADAQLGVELNRLEQLDQVCRVYLVFENRLGTPLDAIQLELVLFDSEGFVWRRLTLDAAPIAADKTSVKLFDLADTQCDRMGRILINDLVEIAGPEGALPNDVSRLDLSTKLEVDLFK